MSRLAKPLAFLATAILLSGCWEQDPNTLRKGDDLYAYYCEACHVESGVGAELAKRSSNTPLKSHEVLLLMTYGNSKIAAHRTPMFAHLTEQQTDAIAEYVSRFK